MSKEDWRGINNVPRIRTEIFESNDSEALNRILSYERHDFDLLLDNSVDKFGKIQDRKPGDKFAINALYFYQWIKFYSEKNDDLEGFTSFLLQNTFLLPIELGGKTQDEANEKALVIFETINNRGMNLEDADIFKAKLFNKAKKINEESIFIDLWTEFKSSCDNLNLRIDDVFRYYSHIVRGKEGITSSEKNLREFFTRETFSPFELKRYKEVLDDLLKILEAIEFINKEKIGKSSITSWLQVLSLYTNQYPQYAIVNYLFINGLDIDYNIEEFLKSLLRFVYYQGSTSTVKFEIYNIIKQVSQKQKVPDYTRKDASEDDFDYLGRLKRGFALLAYYLQKQPILPSYVVDRIIGMKDEKDLGNDWSDIDIMEILDNIANYIVVETSKKNLPFERRMNYYIERGCTEVKQFAENGYTKRDFIKRENDLKNRLLHFFSGRNA